MITAPAAIARADQVAARPAEASADRVLEALDGSRIGDLSLIETLLRQGQISTSDRALLEAQRAAALLRDKDSKEALARYFESGDARPKRLERAHTMAAEGAFFAGRYSEAARHAANILAAPGSRTADETEAIERLKRIAELLTKVPPQALLDRGSGAPVPIDRDKVGLIRMPIRLGTSVQEAVIDTGANLSVVSASTARRLGVRMMEGDADVGNSLGGGVAVRIGIADRLEVAGAVLSNVVFLVMEDEALTFPVPGGYRIEAIIGLPVLRAIGRFSFERADSFRVEPPQPVAVTAAKLRMSGSNPYAVVAIAGKEHPLFLDTGANSSLLSVRFAREHPELKGAQRLESGRAGAGGVERVRRQRIQQVPIRIGKVEAKLSSLDIENEPTPGEEDRYGVLGADLLRVFEKVTLDFQAMTLEVDAPA
ncbi:hypothetical protein GON01_09280 [Sphingomonas sp. MAH-20]|uniref:Peptidase A2 domain-containing protein n=1 Tax=Sphingomonas horti TaxID=2682842 RepID=A0A6I4J1I3_9SPHN|nr:hypothetical protein [Sphingomonas horti]